MGSDTFREAVVNILLPSGLNELLSQVERPRYRLWHVYPTVTFVAMLALELVNVGTTYAAIGDVLGDARAGWLPLAAALTVGLGALDFGGLWRLFWRPVAGDPAVPFTLGAWLVAAIANAFGTWYAVGLALATRARGAPAFVEHEALVAWAPVLLATAVLLARVLIIAAWAVDLGGRYRPGAHFADEREEQIGVNDGH